MLDDTARRQDFPSLAGLTYLNTAAEGIPPLAVGRALDAYFRDKQDGSPARDRHFEQWEQARAAAARMLGFGPAEVAICSSSSEAFNLLALALSLRPGDEVVINDLDFPAGRTPWLQPPCPAGIRVWRSREGALRTQDLVPLLSPRVRLVTGSLVSYWNGFMLSVPEVAAAVRQHSPALLALDVTQGLGRVPLDLSGVDVVISSTHKWILASHGGGIVGVREAIADRLTVPAGGWFNLQNAFEAESLERVETRPGAAGFMVGMPNFPAVYAARAGLDYIEQVGVEAIDRAARPLVHACLEGLRRLPVEILTPGEDEALAGILAFRHPQMDRIAAGLSAAGVHVMHSAGRIRVSLHGYNTTADVEAFLARLAEAVE